MTDSRILVRGVMVLGVLTAASFAACAGSTESALHGEHQTLVHDGIERSYLVRVPPDSIQTREVLPLVLVLHGGGGNAEVTERMTGFTEKAAREGFIVVYPEGTSRFTGKLLTWNAGHCCGYAMEHQVDDVGFISALLDKLIQEYRVDSARIYVTGMSNGGMLTHRLGIQLSDRFAAIAPVVATLFGDETPPALPVSAIMINGLLDQAVPTQGGPPGGRFLTAWDGTPAKPALSQGIFWAGSNDCGTTPVSDDRGTYVLWRYLCPEGRAVELYLVKDSGHAWPGGEKGGRRGDQPGSSLNGTDVIWTFFKNYPRQ
ncbi:MAG: prolyl oligopeptidase family serine peptidase [Gammaproteobacteria bacterium]|nr:prolyl oligopeptidase family serine peptidase [Gammaproteobacteria bacterium]